MSHDAPKFRFGVAVEKPEDELMTDEQVQSMLRAVEHAAENYQTVPASDARFLLAHIAMRDADLAAARADVARLREALQRILEDKRLHVPDWYASIARAALAATAKP